MVRFRIEALGSFAHSLGALKDHLQEFLDADIQLFLGNLASLHILHQVDGAACAGGGHHQVGAVADSFGVLVVSAPVGDHIAVKAPLVAEDFGQKVIILVGIHTVDLIVGGHQRLGVTLLDGDLKAGQVDLPHGPLVHHGIHGHTAQLLGVDGEMLGTGGRALGLDAPDIGRGHLACQIGVLREVFKVSSTEGAALHIQAGAQNHVDILRGGFRAQSLAQLLAQLHIPGVCHGRGSRETGSRHRRIQAQVISGACLLPQTGGAVGHEDGGDTQPLHLPAGPGGPALKQGSFFLQGQFADVFVEVHRNSLLSISAVEMPASACPVLASVQRGTRPPSRGREAGGRWKITWFQRWPSCTS